MNAWENDEPVVHNGNTSSISPLHQISNERKTMTLHGQF